MKTMLASGQKSRGLRSQGHVRGGYIMLKGSETSQVLGSLARQRYGHTSWDYKFSVDSKTWFGKYIRLRKQTCSWKVWRLYNNVAPFLASQKCSLIFTSIECLGEPSGSPSFHTSHDVCSLKVGAKWDLSSSGTSLVTGIEI